MLLDQLERRYEGTEMAAEITEEAIYGALKTVMDPELGHDIVKLGFVQDIDIVGDYVHLEIQLTTPLCPRADEIVSAIKNAVLQIDGINNVEVERTCEKEA